MNFVDYCLWRVDAEMRTWPDEGVDEGERAKRVERLRDAVEQLARRVEDATRDDCAYQSRHDELFRDMQGPAYRAADR